MLSLSIRQVSKKLQDGLLLPSELCTSCLRYAEQLKDLNMFVRLLKEGALSRATIADARYKEDKVGVLQFLLDCLTAMKYMVHFHPTNLDRQILGSAKGLLDGIPVAVKDNFCTLNVETTCGSRILEHFRPKYNATVVQKLEDAGAVLVGKCNMDEFAMGSGTVDSMHGPTRNIWGSHHKYKLVKKSSTLNVESPRSSGDDFFIAGGSSGGSAVAVASGTAFAALGSDTGGSTRIPASYCGIVGLKPSYGLLSRHGLIPLVNSLDVPGILTRSVDDAGTLLNVLAGHDPLDSTTIPDEFKPVDLSYNMDIRKLKIGVPQEYHCPGMSSEVVEAWGEVTDLLEAAGAEVEKVSMPHTPFSIACYSVLNQCEVASNMARYDGIEFGLRTAENRSTEQLYASSRSQGFNEVVRGRILAGNYFLLQRNYSEYFVQALKVRRLISEDFRKLWSSGVDILLTPMTLTEAPLYSWFTSKESREQSAEQDYCSQPANMAGVPAISIPVKLSRQGLPLSIQLMAPIYRDDMLLATAKWIENAVDFPRLEVEGDW